MAKGFIIRLLRPGRQTQNHILNFFLKPVPIDAHLLCLSCSAILVCWYRIILISRPLPTQQSFPCFHTFNLYLSLVQNLDFRKCTCKQKCNYHSWGSKKESKVQRLRDSDIKTVMRELSERTPRNNTARPTFKLLICDS